MHNFASNAAACSYRLKVGGLLDDEFLAAYCPPGTHMQHDGQTTVLSGIDTDQSGIMGLMRHLHNLGCTLLEMTLCNTEEIK